MLETLRILRLKGIILTGVFVSFLPLIIWICYLYTDWKNTQKIKREQQLREQWLNQLKSEYRAKVISHSKRYLELCKIMGNYSFEPVYNDYVYINVNTLAKFKAFNIDGYIEQYIRVNRESILMTSIKLTCNKYEKQKYNSALSKLPPLLSEEYCTNNNINYSIYHEVEIEECASVTLNIPVDKQVNFVIKYDTPAGRNHYTNKITKSISELMVILRSIEEREKHKDKRKMERQQLTPSLRYDIMKRDGFRCTICGRTAEDGVKLHVDHIKPVSKGGLTVPENLRTLCQDCNLGKSDKYSEGEIN